MTFDEFRIVHAARVARSWPLPSRHSIRSALCFSLGFAAAVALYAL